MNKSSTTAKIFLTLWQLVATLTGFLLAFTMGAAMIRHINAGGDKIPEAIKSVVEQLAVLPGLVKQAALELRDQIPGRPSALLFPKAKVMHTHWVHKFPAPEDDGYLLLSGLSQP